MSIIADTLERLKARSTGPQPDSTDDYSSDSSNTHEEKTARHLKSSESKLGMIAIGITLGFGGLALSAYWVGWHLDFGFSANTHARVGNNHLESLPSLESDVPTFTHTPSESVPATIPEPLQVSSALPAKTNQEGTSPPTVAPIDPSQTLKPSPQPTPEQSHAVMAQQDQPAARTLPEQNVNIASIDSAKTEDRVSTPMAARSEKPLAILSETEQPALQVDPPSTKEVIAEEIKDVKQIESLATPLAEEIVETEEIFTTDTSLTKSTDSTINLAKLQEGSKAASLDTLPLGTSPLNRLPHAQQLIRSRKYEDAVALLSPLFHDPPVEWQPWFWMGTALLGKGDMEQADQFFLSGLARNDKVPQLWIQRALVAQQRGDFQLAVHDLRQAESLEPDIPHIPLNLGYAYEQLGNDRLANQYYGKFLKLSEGQPAFFSTRKKLFARLTQQTSESIHPDVTPPSLPLP